MSILKRILIVEDDPLIAMDLEDELADHGMPAVWAISVAQAHSILDTEMPWVAILDMNLKTETSFAIAERLLREEVPFVFVSGNDVSSLPDHLKSSTILSKPVMLGDVIREIKTLGAP